MKVRCYNPKDPGYHNYGGRGITICAEWRKSVKAFADWAMANGYGPELQVDRIDNNGNYEPGNCRFSTFIEQGLNRRTNVKWEAFGESKALTEWARDPRCVVGRNTLEGRVRYYGFKLEDAIVTPPLHAPWGSGNRKKAA